MAGLLGGGWGAQAYGALAPGSIQHTAQVTRTITQIGNARVEKVLSISQVGNARIINPTPDKRPQQWSDSDPETAALWSEDQQLQQAWAETEATPESTWQNSEEEQSQQWSDSDNKASAEWRRQFYD